MTIIKKLVETDSKFLEAVSHMILIDGVRYFYMPFWYEQIGEGLYKEHRFEDLPLDLKKQIEEDRKLIQ